MHLLYLTQPSIKGVIRVLRLRDKDLTGGNSLLTKSNGAHRGMGRQSVHARMSAWAASGINEGRQLVLGACTRGL
jgi:hypothetical protein